MKIKPPIVIFGIIMIAAVALIVRHATRPARSVVSAPAEDAKSATPEPAEPAASGKSIEPQVSTPAENDAPIVFYGRLEDQSAVPVVGAEITGTTIFHQGTATVTAQFMTRSDENGLFTLDAGVGESLKLMPRKTGYALASTNTVGYYTRLKPEAQRQHPDSNNPVLIKMWKLQGAEPLVSFDRKYQFPASNAPVMFDFMTQEAAASGGDIKITVVQPNDLMSNPRVELEAVDGGFIQTSLENWKITYWAPVDGYEPKIALPLTVDANSESADAVLFVQTRQGGIYTKLALKISVDDSPDGLANFEFHGITNTNGSCNWEGDPATFQSE